MFVEERLDIIPQNRPEILSCPKDLDKIWTQIGKPKGQKVGFEQLAMGHNLWLHFGVGEHPFATYFDVSPGAIAKWKRPRDTIQKGFLTPKTFNPPMMSGV